jgi:hypothetical protein
MEEIGMRKLWILLFCLFAVSAQATEICDMNEQGSALVFPLIDNINYRTIVEIANRANTDVWLGGFMIVHPPADPYDFQKKDFLIHLTQKEVFWWSTFAPYDRVDVDGVRTQIPGFFNDKGFMFVWAIDGNDTQLEIDWDFLKGDCLVYGGGNAFQYNAIPHQGLAVVGDRELYLDGVEYCYIPSQIMFEGFAENFSGIGGTLVICSLDIDFILSIQPEFNINFSVWNQYEVNQSRHKDFYQFEQYDLTQDLAFDINSLFTPKWHAAASAPGHSMWAVFFQFVGPYMWGSNVWQHPDPAVIGTATVILPPVPLEK